MTPLAAYLLLFLAVGVGFILVHLLAGKLIRPSTPDAEKGTIYECGEPTIGSAWIQFDLRFYVVALLFVIFDVEVAFFFPWAEVFGKANAVATAPAPPTDQRPWTAEQYNEYARQVIDLGPPPSTMESHKLRPERARYDAFLHLTKDDLETKKSLTQAEVNSLRKMSIADMFTLRELKEEQREQVRKLSAAQLKSIDAQPADPAVAGLAMEAKEALRKAEPADLPVLLDEKYTPAVRALLDRLPVADNAEKASQLAWLAFMEVIVFFGVLLVGFAYLWRRGDLAWVRSVTDQRPAAAPSPVGPSPPPADRALVGAGEPRA